ncbi:valine--tRNA ligase [Candidatus Parcubacteria bacterium]|nr:valine--tRNA ligase [Candidatus Parcubacteria bacterium]
MDSKFLKPYSPIDTESKIYAIWEESGYFNPDNLPHDRQESFSIVLPPPNVTGTLHMGSALMLAIQDTVIRYKRMRGKRALWIPGTDSAAIATQSKVEKEIQKAEGKNRHDLGREELLNRVNTFVEENKSAILAQIRGFGASVDWSRYAYTMDDKRYSAVMEAFVRMYEAGLIYRGHRIVNWDPKGQTTISDDEIVYTEEKTALYYLKYGPFTIATARPETKFGDKYVVMHPSDARYAEYKHGQQLKLEWINGPITATVIKDEAIDMEFGTGVMTITPWHDLTDFDIAERHKLDKEQIIDKYGKLLPVAQDFAGMKIAEAREKIVEKLRSKGLLVREESYTHNVATAERTGGRIEPQIMQQWFIDVNKPIEKRGGKSLKELMRAPLEKGEISIIPEHFDKTYYHWIDNLRDWCISRQIWFGHRIPVWYKGDEIYVGTSAPQGDGWEQDPDVLDTWFSSALWTFSTLGWPEESQDLKLYHPTALLETGYDILFFWVARMIMMSAFHLDQIPFKTVYLHGLVRDKDGQKISKSLGNNIDPREMSARYGTDAVRMALIIGQAAGTDSRISEDKIKGYKNFANKVWNIARFVLDKERGGELKADLVDEFDAMAKDATADMEDYRFYIAAEKIYHYVWHRFADEILEESKGEEKGQIKPEYSATLYYILENSLKLLHPFMPFITEEIWSCLSPKDLLMVEPWPVESDK